MLWSRKPAPVVHDRSRLVGIDLTASRARGISVGSGKTRTLNLDGTAEELRLFVHLDRRPPEVGRAAVAAVRKLPHAVCAGFLPYLGHPKTWQAGRSALTADAALGLAFDKMRGPITAESDAAVIAVPAYLTPPQVGKLAEAAARAKLPLRGTTVAALAVAAHRAGALLGQPDPAPADAPDSDRPDWVVPIRPQDAGPCSVVVVDADEAALTAAVVAVDRGEVRLLGSASWPKLAAKLWTDRLLDAIADKCVRVCRRDPRDSAEAEQAMYEQLPDALDLAARGHPVTLTVRAAHWYQDLTHRPADLEAYCAAFAKQAADGVRELVGSLNLPAPPRVVWLTATAARLPGLAAAVYKGSAERTAVEALGENATAEAAAALAVRWQAGGLPKAHLDAVIPLELTAEPGGEVPYARRAPSRG